uniref:Uncharacterized protein n=1 Tax=Picea glauca TaxID=3330 RepID=A0A117NID6_PICGL|nr:hypothetical protein ABT39_MTgene2974 [Picea glauca]
MHNDIYNSSSPLLVLVGRNEVNSSPYSRACLRILSRWSRVRCLTLSLQSSLLAHPLPLVESSLPHPRPAGRACLTHRMKSISNLLGWKVHPM